MTSSRLAISILLLMAKCDKRPLPNDKFESMIDEWRGKIESNHERRFSRFSGLNNLAAAPPAHCR